MIDSSDPFTQWMTMDAGEEYSLLPPVDSDEDNLLPGLKDITTLGFPSDRESDLALGSGLLFGPNIPYLHLGPASDTILPLPPNSEQTVSLPTLSSPFATPQPPALSPDTSPLSVTSSPWLGTPMIDPSPFDIVGRMPMEAPWHTGDAVESCSIINFVDETGNSLEDVSQIQVRPEDIACTPQVNPCLPPTGFSAFQFLPPTGQTVLPLETIHLSSSPSSPLFPESQPLPGILSPYSQDGYGSSLSPLSPLASISSFSSPNGSPFVNPSLISPALASVSLSEDQEGGPEVVASIEEDTPTSKRIKRVKNMDDEEWQPELEYVRRRRVIWSSEETLSSVIATHPSDEDPESKVSMNKHSSIPDASRTVCQLCRQSFTRESDYNRHVENSASHPQTRRLWPCPYCDKELGRKDALRRHVKTLHIGRSVPILEDTVQDGPGGSLVKRMGQRKISSRRQPKKAPDPVAVTTAFFFALTFMDSAVCPSGSSAQGSSNHLWIPETETTDSTSDAVPSSSRTPLLLKDRLYVGNLSPTVDEYALLQVFSKFGKIAKLDFLFHKSGVNKGKPRGYAFVEFMNEADAAKALQTASGKLLRGRKLVVTFAQQAPSHDTGSSSYIGRSKRSDATPTTLSLVKSSGIARPEAKTSSKIAMMEAKLRQMANSSPFTERAALPSKPTLLQRDVMGGSQSQRTSVLRTTPTTGNTDRTKKDEQLSASTQPPHDMESSDMPRIPPSSKQRSIPGVKIVKGGSNKGDLRSPINTKG